MTVLKTRGLDAYINGRAIAKNENNTWFTGLDGFAFSSSRPPKSVISLKRKGEDEWEEAELELSRQPTWCTLTVFPTEGQGLDVRLNGVVVDPKPIAVSLSLEQRAVDEEQKLMVVLEFSAGTAINEELLSQTFRGSFPAYDDLFKDEPGKAFPGKKAERVRGLIRVLLIEEGINLQEIARDRQHINQLFVVGTPEHARAEIMALEGLPAPMS